MIVSSLGNFVRSEKFPNIYYKFVYFRCGTKFIIYIYIIDTFTQ
jgi:hypothetical protein